MFLALVVLHTRCNAMLACAQYSVAGVRGHIDPDRAAAHVCLTCMLVLIVLLTEAQNGMHSS